MRRWALLLALFGAGCSRDWDGLSVATDAGADAGLGGTGGGGGIGGQTCFPGSKVCPDRQGQAVCAAGNDPSTGCGTSSCEPCALPHATAKCDGAGECAIETCSTGFSDCDGDPATGCEANIQFDPTHCGSCSMDCTSQGTGWICAQGSCTQSSCNPPTTGDCDGNEQNGCETDLLTDDNNCGFCTNACSASGTTCANGQCVVSGCTKPYADCDGIDGNGCEANLNTDAANCGGCGTKCGSANGSAGCVGGTCVLLCSAGWDDCDGNSANGCETNLQTTIAHCGQCNSVCAPAHVNSAQCNLGVCGHGSCAPLWGDCDGNTSNGCETDLASDPNSCGSCGKKCPGGAVCKLGTCGSTCTGGLVNCGGACVSISTSTANCGACGNACTAPANASPKCTAGLCSFVCNANTTNCSGACVNLQTDESNCGACGTTCGSQYQCVGGACTPTS